MNKIIAILLLSSISIFSSSNYNGSTLAPVVIAGGIIKAKHVDDGPTKKYKRKDCPVCKGKGWYISGDGIKKVDCGYCEPESNTDTSTVIRR
jgi:hypothetical protein